MRLRLVLHGIRVMDDRAPEFEPLRFAPARRGVRGADNRMVVAVTVTPGDGGAARRTRLPEDDPDRLHERPFYRPYSLYSLRVDAPVFEGEVGNHLALRIDLLPPDGDVEESVSTYRRQFNGDPACWVGSYGPEAPGAPERAGPWQVSYRIEDAGGAAIP